MHQPRCVGSQFSLFVIQSCSVTGGGAVDKVQLCNGFSVPFYRDVSVQWTGAVLALLSMFACCGTEI